MIGPDIDIAKQVQHDDGMVLGQIGHCFGKGARARPGDTGERIGAARPGREAHQPITAILGWTEHGVGTAESDERLGDMNRCEIRDIAPHKHGGTRRGLFEGAMHAPAQITIALFHHPASQWPKTLTAVE